MRKIFEKCVEIIAVTISMTLLAAVAIVVLPFSLLYEGLDVLCGKHDV